MPRSCLFVFIFFHRLLPLLFFLAFILLISFVCLLFFFACFFFFFAHPTFLNLSSLRLGCLLHADMKCLATVLLRLLQLRRMQRSGDPCPCDCQRQHRSPFLNGRLLSLCVCVLNRACVECVRVHVMASNHSSFKYPADFLTSIWSLFRSFLAIF